MYKYVPQLPNSQQSFLQFVIVHRKIFFSFILIVCNKIFLWVEEFNKIQSQSSENVTGPHAN